MALPAAVKLRSTSLSSLGDPASSRHKRRVQQYWSVTYLPHLNGPVPIGLVLHQLDLTRSLGAIEARACCGKIYR